MFVGDYFFIGVGGFFLIGEFSIYGLNLFLVGLLVFVFFFF